MARVFIVEDEIIFQLELTHRMEDLGHEVLGCVDNGKDAIDVVTNLKPDLILMDININGEIDGIETARIIREKISVPIIFLTAYSDKNTLTRAKINTPHAYLIKPINDENLYISIEVALAKFEVEKKLIESERKLFVTLNSIGDGVISTDEYSLVTFMNPRAEYMCGISLEAAKGLHLKEVFNIVNASSRKEVINPVEEVLRTGKIVELANHTILISKNGSERHIADSAAPIINSEGKIEGVVLVFSDVSEAYQQREKIKQSEKVYREVVENASDIIYSMDINGKILHANSSAHKITGYDLEDVKEMSFTDFVAPEYRATVKRKIFKQLITKEQTIYFEVPVLKKDNTLIWLGSNINLIKNSNEVEGFHIVSRDITDKIYAERKIEQQRSLYEAILEQSMAGYWDWMIQENTEYLSPAFKKMLGYEDHELENKPETWQMLINQEDLQNVFEVFNKHIESKGKIPFYNEVRYNHKNGYTIWVICTGKVIEWDEDGNAVRMIGCHIDITDRKKAEEDLHTSEKRYRQIIENMEEGHGIVDSTEKFVFCNPSAEYIMGVEKGTLVGRNLKEFVFDNQLEIMNGETNKRSLGQKSRYEIEIVQPSGNKRLLDLTAIPQYDQNGLYIGTFGTFRDITERKKAEIALRESEELHRKLMNAVPDLIIRTDINGYITFINELSYASLTQIPSERILGKNMISFIADEDKQRAIDNTKLMFEKSLGPQEYKIVFNEGTFFYSEVNGEVILDTNNKPTGMVYVIRDITERKLMEIEKQKMLEDLVIAKEKAEEMNRIKSSFFANMSHELRTPFVGILGYAEMLSETVQDPVEKSMADGILKASNRMKETLTRILGLAKLESDSFMLIMKKVDVYELLMGTYEMFKGGVIQTDVSFIIDLDFEELIIESDGSLLNDILQNIVSNAIKFTYKGEIRISSMLTKKNNTSVLSISVKDTGVGIPKEKQEIIWEPFRQASEGLDREYEGTGLGLSIVKKCTEHLGGNVVVVSEIGRGSTFTLEIPVKIIKEKIKKKNSDVVLPVNNYINKKILHVDDDEFSRAVIKQFLTGYCHIDTVISANEALEKVNKNMYDALLMDINLKSKVSGVVLTQEIRKISGYADTPIIAVTAYASEEDKERFLSQGLTHYIAKPFKKIELRNLLNSVFKELELEINRN